MLVDQISNLQAVAFIAGVLVFAWIFLRIIPSGEDSPQRDSFTSEQISAYDHQLPKYFLAAAVALIVGGLHTVIKNVPGFWQWLWEAGYGGHVFRDLSNSHIIIVGGGTVLLTAITWYLLPRAVNRPLFSTFLAGASLLFTVIGVFGFYLAWLVLGLVEGHMVVNGWNYLAAKEALGNWHRLPTAISASIMGIGYWTYVLNVFLTVLAARRVAHKPLGYLTKFIVVSATALFVGTVQGVIQVMPDHADWIRAAGKFGQYVDPISHAHVNLVTGVMVSLAAFLIFFAPQIKGRSISKTAANRLFWLFVPASVLFYLTFLLLGLVLGGSSLTRALPEQAVAFLANQRALLLAISGSLLFVGFWAFFVTLWRNLSWRSWLQQLRGATPAAFWLVSSAALVMGTFQGLLQVMPATARILTVPEEVPNIHAQLNMIGGVILALLGVVYLLLPKLLDKPLSKRLMKFSLWGISSGIGAYYLVTLSTGLLRLGYLRQGFTDAEAAAQLGWAASALAMLTAVPMLTGYTAFGLALWRITTEYRSHWWTALRQMPSRINGQPAPWQERIPRSYPLAAETLSAMFGFPGLGWILGGQALLGLPLMLIGPAVAWAIIPLLSSPYGDGILVRWGGSSLIVYLILSTMLSVGGLWLVTRRTTVQAVTQEN